MNVKSSMPGAMVATVRTGVRRSASFHDPRAEWPAARRLAYDFVEGSPVKAAIGLCIVCNTAVVVLETDLSAACDSPTAPANCESDSAFTRAANMIFLFIYVAEMLLKIFAHRLEYFLGPSDLFDMFIVTVGILGMLLGNVLPGVGILRLFRVARVMRAVKITQKCDEVKVFISGIASAAKAIVVGAVLIFFSLFLFSIAAVMLLNPVNQELVRQGAFDDEECERCARAFSSVTEAMLTLLQIVLMGDAWGDFAVTIIESEPWTVIFFVMTSFTITLGLTNLVLAVIVDKALQNREVNLQKQAAEHTRELEAAQQHFVNLCAEIDEDQSGSVTLQELLSGFENPDFKAVLTLMDIQKDDLKHVFDVMDQDKSGSVSYEEFSMQLQSLKSQDLHTMTSFVKHYVFEMHDQLLELRNLHHAKEPKRQRMGTGTKEAEEATVASVQLTSQAPLAEAPARTPIDVTRINLPVRATFDPSAGGVLCVQMQDVLRKLDNQVALLQQTLACEMELRTSVLQALILNTGDAPATIVQPEQEFASATTTKLIRSELNSSSLSPVLAMEASTSSGGTRASEVQAARELVKFAGTKVRPASGPAFGGSVGGTSLLL